jgi:phage tail protein X
MATIANTPSVPYTTTGGENWGMISYEAYGDEGLIKTITDANPTVAITPILPAGIVLSIPVVDKPASNINTQLLPPWKR